MKLLRPIKWSASTSHLSVGLMLGVIAVGSGHISIASAATAINFDDQTTNVLHTSPSWAESKANSIYVYPDPNTSPSDNHITVNYTSNSTGTPMNVYGGLVQDGTTENNVVSLINGTVSDTVYGGYGAATASGGTGEVVVRHNNVFINGSATKINNVRGGYIKRSIGNTNNLSVTNNTVTIAGDNNSNSTGSPSIYGGFIDGVSSVSTSGNARVAHNGISITGHDINHNTFAYVAGGFIQGETHATLEENYVNVDGGKFTGITGAEANTNAHMVPGQSIRDDNITHKNNHVTVTNSLVEGMVIGSSSNASIINTSGTNVTLDRSMAAEVYGDFAYKNDTNGTITLHDSTININSSTTGFVFGSLAYLAGGTLTESGNQINISGNSHISNNIFGGWASGNGNFSTTSNTVTLNGTGITIGGTIYGGWVSNSTAFNKVTAGNKLVLNGYRGSIGGIRNFEKYEWTLPSDTHNNDVLVTIVGNTPVDLTNTKHIIHGMDASPTNRLHAGDVITLISKSSGTWTPEDTSLNHDITQGQFLVYHATLSQAGGADNPFILTINAANGHGGNGSSAAELNPQSKAYSEGRIAALGLVNQGGDLISTAGIDHIRTMVRANDEKANHPALIPFAITNGSSLRYKTGSHVDINSFNLAAGLATGLNFASGSKATVGAFFEYGHGDYDTYNRFAHFASVRGDGNSHYQGGGVFGRIDVAGTGLGHVSQLPADQADGLYAEASLRAGNVNSEFDVGRNANVLGDFTGDYRGSYRSKVDYYGGHLAGGYVFNFDDKQSLDTYARYLWTKMNSDTVRIDNEPLHFDSTDSSRFQIGGRYGYALNERFKPYVGINYEYEFDGKAKAKAYEFKLDRPTLKGSTGIFEAGFHFQPMANDASFSVDVTGQGYVGKRQGGGGNVKVKYQF